MPSPNLTAARRTGLLWLHILCGGAATLTLLSQENLSLRFVFSGVRTRGIGVALAALPAALPYIVSFVIAKHVVPDKGVYLRTYALILLVGTVAGVWCVMRTASVDTALLVALIQATIFAAFGHWINAHDEARRDA